MIDKGRPLGSVNVRMRPRSKGRALPRTIYPGDNPQDFERLPLGRSGGDVPAGRVPRLDQLGDCLSREQDPGLQNLVGRRRSRLAHQPLKLLPGSHQLVPLVIPFARHARQRDISETGRGGVFL